MRFWGACRFLSYRFKTFLEFLTKDLNHKARSNEDAGFFLWSNFYF